MQNSSAHSPSFRARAALAVRGLDGRVKIALLLAYSIMLFLIDGLGGLAGAALLLLAVLVAGRLSLGRVVRAAGPAYGIIAFILLYNLVSAGWIQAALVTGRLGLLVWGSIALVELSTPDELAEALRRLLAPLGCVGLPAHDAACALSIALRFMPVIAEELSAVRAAQASRGAHFADGSVGQRLGAWAHLLAPVFVGLFRRADRLACAMDARCFGASETPTSLGTRRLGLGDGAVLLIGLALCTGLALAF